MIPDVALLTLVLSLLAMAARFSKLGMSLIAALLGKDLIGSLRQGYKGAHPPQALPSPE